MTEQKPWDEIGITEDKFYSVEAIEYWKTISSELLVGAYSQCRR